MIKNLTTITIITNISFFCNHYHNTNSKATTTKIYPIQAIGLMNRVFTNGQGDWRSIPGQVIPKTEKNGT